MGGRRVYSEKALSRGIEQAIKGDSEKILKDLNRGKRRILDYVGSNGVEKTRELVREYFYNSLPEGSAYTRLEEDGGFLNTISYTVQNDKIKIYCDWGKLGYDYVESGLSSHIGFDGSAFTEGLYEYIIEGSFPNPSGVKVSSRVLNYNGMEQELNEELSEFYTNLAREEIEKDLQKIVGTSSFVHLIHKEGNVLHINKRN